MFTVHSEKLHAHIHNSCFPNRMWSSTPEHKQTQIKLQYQNVLLLERKKKKDQPPLKKNLGITRFSDTKQQKAGKQSQSVCLCCMVNRERLRSVRQGLVLHGVLVLSQQVALRRTDAACYRSLVSRSEYFLPTPVNRDSNHPKASSVAQRGGRHWPCWSVTGAPAHRSRSALRLRPTSDSPSVIQGQKAWSLAVINGR